MTRNKNKSLPIYYGLQFCLVIATVKSAYDYFVLPNEYLPVLHGVLAIFSIVAIVVLFLSMRNNNPLHKLYVAPLFVVILYFMIEGTAAIGFTIADNNLVSNLGFVISNLSYAIFTYLMAVLAYFQLKSKK